MIIVGPGGGAGTPNVLNQQKSLALGTINELNSVYE